MKPKPPLDGQLQGLAGGTGLRTWQFFESSCLLPPQDLFRSTVQSLLNLLKKTVAEKPWRIECFLSVSGEEPREVAVFLSQGNKEPSKCGSALSSPTVGKPRSSNSSYGWVGSSLEPLKQRLHPSMLLVSTAWLLHLHMAIIPM